MNIKQNLFSGNLKLGEWCYKTNRTCQTKSGCNGCASNLVDKKKGVN